MSVKAHTRCTIVITTIIMRILKELVKKLKVLVPPFPTMLIIVILHHLDFAVPALLISIYPQSNISTYLPSKHL